MFIVKLDIFMRTIDVWSHEDIDETEYNEYRRANIAHHFDLFRNGHCRGDLR